VFCQDVPEDERAQYVFEELPVQSNHGNGYRGLTLHVRIRSYGAELWEFDGEGQMRKLASINEAPIQFEVRRRARILKGKIRGEFACTSRKSDGIR
jgi:hypothetical protein